MIDYLRNLFISWFNKILNWFSERQKKEMNTKKEIPFDKNKHADDDRQKRISEGFKALDDGCKSIANLRAEIEMSQTETFKDNEPEVNNDLDAPVPANNNIKNNLEEDKMGNFPIKGIKKFFCGPSNSEECEEDIKKKEEEMEKLKQKHEEFLIKEMEKLKQKHEEFLIKEGKKIIPSNISPISMRSNNDNSNWMDPNDLNNTFEYQDEKVQKAMKGENNKMGELINKKAEEIKQNVKQEIKNQLAESKIQEQLDNHEEKINKNTEDIKKNTEDIKKTQEEQFDIKKMLAKHDEMIADNKRRLDKAEKMLAEIKEERKDTKRMLAEMKQQTAKMDEKWREHDAKWMEMFGPYLKKKPRSSRSDNRESTNTSFSSFRGYMNMNNSHIPKMERADMAHSYDENQ